MLVVKISTGTHGGINMLLKIWEFLKKNLLEMLGGLLLVLQGLKAMIPGTRDDEALDKALKPLLYLKELILKLFK